MYNIIISVNVTLCTARLPWNSPMRPRRYYCADGNAFNKRLKTASVTFRILNNFSMQSDWQWRKHRSGRKLVNIATGKALQREKLAEERS